MAARPPAVSNRLSPGSPFRKGIAQMTPRSSNVIQRMVLHESDTNNDFIITSPHGLVTATFISITEGGMYEFRYRGGTVLVSEKHVLSAATTQSNAMEDTGSSVGQQNDMTGKDEEDERQESMMPATSSASNSNASNSNASKLVLKEELEAFCREVGLTVDAFEILISYGPEAIKQTIKTTGTSKDEKERADTMSNKELFDWAVKRKVPGVCGHTANLLQSLGTGGSELIEQGDEKLLRKALTNLDNIICRVDLGGNHSFIAEKVGGRIQVLQSFIGAFSLAKSVSMATDKKVNDVMRMVRDVVNLGNKCRVQVYNKVNSTEVREALRKQYAEANRTWGF